MAETVRFDIFVDDRGSAVLKEFQREAQQTAQGVSRSFDQARDAGGRLNKGQEDVRQGARQAREEFGRYTKATEDLARGSQQASQQVGGLGSSLLGAIKSGAGFAAGFAGITAVGTVIAGAAQSAVGFQREFKAIEAVGLATGAGLEKLRQQVLDLPPALGNATELAAGLNSVLQANIPAENAVKVLADSAELAKGGLGNLDTAITAVTKSAAAFNIPLSESQKIADFFTKTVTLGQGTLQEFASAFPQVTQTAAAAGASFLDTNAAMGVLTQTFKNADTAATGLQSLFSQLIKNSAALAAEGINVQKVLAEEGMTGLLRRLNEVTHGSSQRLNALINDSEGFRAALALTGSQQDLFNKSVGEYAEVTGLAHKAAVINAQGAGAAWTTLINTVDRLVQQVAPPLLAIFTDIAGSATGVATSVGKLFDAFQRSEEVARVTRSFTEFFQLLSQTDTTQGATAGLSDLNTNLLSTAGLVDQTYNAFTVLAQLMDGNVRPAIDFLTAGWDLLNATFNYTVAGVLKLGQYLVDYVVHPTFQVIEVMDKAAYALGIGSGEFTHLSDSSAQLSKDLSEASSTFAEMADEFVLGSNRTAAATTAAGEATTKTTAATKTQAQTLFEQALAQEKASAATTQGTKAQEDANKAYAEATTAASTFKATLALLKPGDILEAIPAEELATKVALVITNLKDLEKTGEFSAGQIQTAYGDAADVLQKRFGELPATFQKAYDDFLAKTRATAADLKLIFDRLGIETKETQQKTATDFGKDLLALLQQTRQKTTESVELVKDATGQYRIQAKASVDGMGNDLRGSVTATTQDLLTTFHQWIDDINRGEFKQLPENFREITAQLGPLARRAGGEVLKEFRDANGNIRLEWQKLPDAFDVVYSKIVELTIKFGGNAVDHLDPATRAIAEKFGLVRKAGDSATVSLHALDAQAQRLGHTLNAEGQEVNAYGNAIARLSDETQRLLDLQVSIETPFAKDLPGLQKQLAEAYADLLRIPERTGLGPEGMKQQREVLQDEIRRIKELIAELQGEERQLQDAVASGGNGVGGGGGGSRPGLEVLEGGGGDSPTLLRDRQRQEEQFARDRQRIEAQMIAFERQVEQQRRELEAQKKQALQVDRGAELAIEARFEGARQALDAEYVAHERETAAARKVLEAEKKAALAAGGEDELQIVEAIEAKIQELNVQALARKRQIDSTAESLEIAIAQRKKDAGDQQIAAAEVFEQRIQELDLRVLDQKRKFNEQLADLEREKQDILAGNLPGGRSGAGGGSQSPARPGLTLPTNSPVAGLDIGGILTTPGLSPPTRPPRLQPDVGRDMPSSPPGFHFEYVSGVAFLVQDGPAPAYPDGTFAQPSLGSLANPLQPAPGTSLRPPTVTTGSAPQQDRFPRAGFNTGGGGGGGGSRFPTADFNFGVNTDITGVRRFAGGGVVPGAGGTDSVLAHVSPGELIIAPDDVQGVLDAVRQGGRQGAPITIIQAPITIQILLSQASLSRIDAQSIVTQLTPALQEAIDRHQLFARR